MPRWLQQPIPLYLALVPLAVTTVALALVVVMVVAMRWVDERETAVRAGEQFVYVAHLRDDCEAYSPPQRIIVLPIGFSVEPLQAAKALPRCWRKLTTGVYADGENYYFFNTLGGHPSSYEVLRQHSYVVDGKTGQLVGVPES